MQRARRRFSPNSVETSMSAPHTVRVFVASDVGVYREGISRLIATADSVELAGAAATGDSAARLRGARPDVVLVDAIEPVDLVLVREIGSAAGDAHIVAL